MKIRIYFTLALCLFGLSGAFAQKGFHIGAGYSYYATSLLDKIKYGDVDYNADFEYGPAYGIAVGNNFTDMFGIQVELNRANMGGHFHYPDNFTRTLDMTYYQVPVLLRITGGDFKSRFTAGFGPQFGWLSSARMNSTGGRMVTENADVTSKFERSDINLMLTAGGDISVYKDLYLSLGLRFLYGARSISKENVLTEDPTHTEKLSNMAGGATIGLHYLFRDK